MRKLGKIVDYDGNMIVDNIIVDIVNIDGLIYAKEIYTGCLFPMMLDKYQDIENYPSVINKSPLSVDFISDDYVDDVEYRLELDNNCEKVHKIQICSKYGHFIENPYNDFNKGSKINIDDQIFSDYIVSESGSYKSEFKVFYRLIRLGTFIYAKEIKSNLIFPIYIDGFNSKAVNSTDYNGDNNRYINFSAKVWGDGDELYVDKLPIDSVVDSSIRIDAYLQEFNMVDEVTRLRNMNIFTQNDLNYHRRLPKSNKKYNKNINTIDKKKSSQIISNKDDLLISNFDTIVNLKNIPGECFIVNDRDNLITIVGRERETKELVKNVLIGNESVILIGDAGVGKTALVENLARLINSKDKSYYLNKFIVEVNTGSLLSGTKYRGEFEEKLQRVIDFAVKYKGKVILFIDEIHTLYGLGRAEGSVIDAMNILKPYIERKDIQVIGATTKEEYNESIGMDKAFSSRFNTIKLDGLSSSVKEGIVVNYIKELEDVYNIKLDSGIQVDVLAGELVRLADRQDVRYKINSIRILKRVIRGSFNEAIYNEHDKVLLSDIIACLEITDELLVKREYIDSLRSRLGMRSNCKILRLNV